MQRPWVSAGRKASILLLFAVLPLLGGATAHGEAFLPVLGPCGLSFPRDHGEHPGHLTEWWYYTGNLEARDGRPFGFQLTFFRRQILPPGGEEAWPPHASAWRAQSLFMAHGALSDIQGRAFLTDERIARGALGLAGVRGKEEAPEVFLGPWKATLGPSSHHLLASAEGFSLDLRLSPRKGQVAHGVEGYSRKGLRPESASCYYSFSRLEASGRVLVHGRPFGVQGTAWMDHEFSSAPLEKGLVGWDWFCLQLEDNTEVMLYLLRSRDGSLGLASSGTLVLSSGEALHLPREAFRVEVLDHWASPHSGARYPSLWRIRIPSREMDLEVRPRLKDQELRLSRSMEVTYWEGSVKVRGHRGSAPVEGLGYVEMTGYARPFALLQERPE